MEHLTKHQLILLALLVSFVTSIATGIVTVALMSQAPVGVTQTINQVVEHTIEKVIATSTPSSPGGQTTVKETLVVSADTAVVNAIAGTEPSVVRIYQKGVDQTTGVPITSFIGLGTVVAPGGVIATDNGVIAPGGSYLAKSADGTSYDLSVLESSKDQPIALLGPQGTSSPAIAPVSVAASDLKLGQEIVGISGETKSTVATGIVSSLDTKTVTVPAASSTASSTTATAVAAVDTSLSAADFVPGEPLVDLSGDLVGIKAALSAGSNLFAPASSISAALAAYVSSTAASSSSAR